MERTFEDAIMDVQGKMISLSLEALSISGASVDTVYIYCYNCNGSMSVIQFFAQQGEIKHTNAVGLSYKILEQMDRLFWDDIREINKICEEYDRPKPVEIRMTYAPQTGKFDVKYDYKSFVGRGIHCLDKVEKWMAKEQKMLNKQKAKK